MDNDESQGRDPPAEAAQRPLSERRDDGMPRGRPFPKGRSGNPGGKPKVLAEMKMELESGGVNAARKLVSLVDHPDPKIAIAAARDVIDRLMGKPRSAEDDQQRSTLAAFFAGMMARMDAARAQADADALEDGDDDVA